VSNLIITIAQITAILAALGFCFAVGYGVMVITAILRERKIRLGLRRIKKVKGESWHE